MSCRESIATIETAVAEAQGHNLQLSPPNLNLVIQGKAFPDYTCMQAWAEYGPARSQGIVVDRPHGPKSGGW
jgi:hypothetical protein